VGHVTKWTWRGETVPLAEVLIGRDDLPAGLRITDVEALFERKAFRKGIEPIEGISDPEVIRGKRLSVNLPRGAVITRKQFAEPAPSRPIPEGYRAITLSVKVELQHEELITPGSRVDVLATVTEDGKTFTRTIAEDVMVLSICSESYQVGEKQATTRTVAMSSEQVEKVTAARQKKGTLSLIPRPVEDK
jgi:Flp pilus assembly protein CpaB